MESGSLTAVGPARAGRPAKISIRHLIKRKLGLDELFLDMSQGRKRGEEFTF